MSAYCRLLQEEVHYLEAHLCRAYNYRIWVMSSFHGLHHSSIVRAVVALKNCMHGFRGLPSLKIGWRSREDFLGEWTKRGLMYRPDLTAAIAKDCYMCQLHYLRYNLLIFEVDPSRVVPIDCSAEGRADWAPYENFEEQLVYLPNGTAVPSAKHQHAYGDWQYVLRLKAG